MNAPLPAAPALAAEPLWQARYAELGPAFFTALPPTPLPAPYWVGRNPALAQELGLPEGWLDRETTLQALSGNAILPGSEPVATVYSGHQFGVWAGQLGDGRALLLGELQEQEWQLKGAGRTPYSRMGDGRAVLRSSIREFLCSEAMQALGIPTTRALCVSGSDAPVRRETLETAAVVTRLAPSFIRFGHFEHFCHHGLHDELRQLADYVIARYYPECQDGAGWGGNAYAALLARVTQRTATLLAQWQAVGFCHGVMNTDNMSILGLTIDYGPFQFLDAYDPGHICNHSDHQGRYAFARQPQVAHWNLYCLGQALLPLIEDQDLAITALDSYQPHYNQALSARFAAKLGLLAPSAVADALWPRVLGLLAAERVDYSIFWRRLSHWVAVQDPADATVRDLFLDRAAIDTWLQDFAALHAPQDRAAASQRMLRTNPKYLLRNHVGELAIRAAAQKDCGVVADVLKVLQAPYDEHPAHVAWAGFPPDWAADIAISCSS